VVLKVAIGNFVFIIAVLVAMLILAQRPLTCCINKWKFFHCVFEGNMLSCNKTGVSLLAAASCLCMQMVMLRASMLYDFLSILRLLHQWTALHLRHSVMFLILSRMILEVDRYVVCWINSCLCCRMWPAVWLLQMKSVHCSSTERSFTSSTDKIIIYCCFDDYSWVTAFGLCKHNKPNVDIL